jgi:hypothetical protein
LKVEVGLRDRSAQQTTIKQPPAAISHFFLLHTSLSQTTSFNKAEEKGN